MDVATNLQYMRRTIKQASEKSKRNPDEITIIGVTKYVTIERTREAIQAGIKNLGENRPDGFMEKYNHIGIDAKWHFIGTLQSRKVKDVINKVDVVHSLDRLSLVKEINKRATEQKDCFVQVNVSGEESKHGLRPDEVIPFIKSIERYENVHVVGLMTMAPHLEDKERLREFFQTLADLRNTIKHKKLAHAPCEYLSMGMSNDYEIAIEEGATHIRIGSDLVGQ
ncbi:YggS family pyridoxal phosphate-dependent enzyme [Virgibacillus natechei]|nr:YggS family pyridoxal phosphate-dependent enzyme [Virgibacillus natechei]UZD14898.1 YggS family pyridoxal phosphate-dependent enzyme [Virgibacillus natechei]